ncbi:hypothetical protein TRFO_42614 [Tritrichomonas foetus]|uniref:Uncharacterized protein n=1 Tax=Tritrichomonas foetus TaxID=1144522 RepID=A0A1J4KZY9_9EUKA|nr:hypothetical protein TRFO_42614 [Tritrichomonas foetus]|eukprot:OHT15270.1 hypothetical protein TRFO_42614 [Tritrichomonas foetus]
MVFALVFLGIVFIYSIWKLCKSLIPLCSKTKTTRYISRVFFRTFFMLRVICGLIKWSLFFLNPIYQSPEILLITKFFNSLSLLFLIRSILDFNGFIQDPKIFYEDKWLIISIPPLILYLIFPIKYEIENLLQFNNYSIFYEFENISFCELITQGIYISYNIGLIAIPGLYLIHQLYKSDVTKEYEKEILLSLGFYIFIILYDIISYLISISLMRNFRWDDALIYDFFDLATCLVTGLTQDVIDHILNKIRVLDIYVSDDSQYNLL